MRHYKKGRKLGTSASHTKAIKKNLVNALFINDRIKTTLERAKEIRGDVDRIVTWAKRGDVHSRRLAIAALGDKDLVAEIFTKVDQGLFKDRPGGYTRIMRLGNRRGDAAPIVIMELVQEPVVKKGTVAEPAKKSVISRVTGKGKTAKAVDTVVEAEEAVVEEPTGELVEAVSEIAVEEAVIEEVVADEAAVAEGEAAEVVAEVVAEETQETEDTDK